MSKSNMEIINFIADGMTSAELINVIKLLDTKRKEKEEIEREQEYNNKMKIIKEKLAAGEPVSMSAFRELNDHEQTGYSSWCNKFSSARWTIRNSYRGGNCGEWQAVILDYNKDKLKEFFEEQKEKRAEDKRRQAKFRRQQIQAELDLKTKAFDIKKMAQLPDLVGKYCLSFLSTPETAEETQKNKDYDRKCRYLDNGFNKQRPARLWEQVMNYVWWHTWDNKYKPLLMAKYEKVSFEKIKTFHSRNQDRFRNVGYEKLSRSSKKLFLEQIKYGELDKNIKVLEYVNAVLGFK